MKVYLVGGAVRDKLLGRHVQDYDYLVVGSTVQQMLDLGFVQVGKSFPVFLHPETKCEYALARLERKVGKGYSGFDFDFSSNVTLEQDLYRRDLTINAMAMDESGELYDPYLGKQDLDNKIIRHVSNAFVEDPLRVLRVARFYADLNDFIVCDETMRLLKTMSGSGELNHLTVERVMSEIYKALSTDSPWRFFDLLSYIDALKIWWPDFSQHISTLQKHLDGAVKVTQDPYVRFAAMCASIALPSTFVYTKKQKQLHGSAFLLLSYDFINIYKHEPHLVYEFCLKIGVFKNDFVITNIDLLSKSIFYSHDNTVAIRLLKSIHQNHLRLDQQQVIANNHMLLPQEALRKTRIEIIEVALKAL